MWAAVSFFSAVPGRHRASISPSASVPSRLEAGLPARGLDIRWMWQIRAGAQPGKRPLPGASPCSAKQQPQTFGHGEARWLGSGSRGGREWTRRGTWFCSSQHPATALLSGHGAGTTSTGPVCPQNSPRWQRHSALCCLLQSSI